MQSTTSWTEAKLLQLERDEHDFQEFKGSAFLAEDREISSEFVFALSKQVSAFSNGAGGRLFIGINDLGVIDGGVPVDLKGGGTRAWLEDIIPGLVTPNLTRFNVYEVPASGLDSAILPEHAVYIVDIRESPEAPHQARDMRYYLRIAGKSRPMGHVHIQDVLRRTRNPRMALSNLRPFGEPELDTDDPRGHRVFVAFRTHFVNQSRTLAQHVGVEVVLPRSLVGKEVRRRILDPGDIHYTQRPGEVAFFRKHDNPVFPGQELFFLMFWVGIHRANLGFVKRHAEIGWRVWADDSEVVEGSVRLSEFSAIRRATHMIEGGELDK